MRKCSASVHKWENAVQVFTNGKMQCLPGSTVPARLAALVGTLAGSVAGSIQVRPRTKTKELKQCRRLGEVPFIVELRYLNALVTLNLKDQQPQVTLPL